MSRENQENQFINELFEQARLSFNLNRYRDTIVIETCCLKNREVERRDKGDKVYILVDGAFLRDLNFMRYSMIFSSPSLDQKTVLGLPLIRDEDLARELLKTEDIFA